MVALDRDSELVAAALDGDRTAFRRLIDPHHEALRRLTYSVTGDAHLMDDALQEGYLKAYRSLRSFRGKSSFRTWLHRIVYNAAIDVSRKNRRIVPIGGEHQANVVQAPQVDVALRLDIDAAFSKITQPQRSAVMLVDGIGMDYAAAADVLGLAPGTLASHVTRGRAALRALLSNEQ